MLRTGMEEGDLFRQSPSSTPPEIRLIEEPKEENQDSKAEEASIIESPSMPVKPPENTPKRVERIMVFYSDNTFETFVPEKSGKE